MFGVDGGFGIFLLPNKLLSSFLCSCLFASPYPNRLWNHGLSSGYFFRAEEASLERKRAMLDEWYRDQIKQAAPELIAKWKRVGEAAM